MFGVWCLAHRSYTAMPWIIVDFKGDELIGQIPRLREIGMSEKIPRHPGLHVVRPHPNDIDDGGLTAWLFRVWERERVGLFIDEGYMIPQRDKGLRAVLTQGRSKRIPVIGLAQRPRDISTFLLSESEVKSVFRLDHPDDTARMREYIPGQDQHGRRIDPLLLPRFSSYWYSSEDWTLHRFGQCPAPAEILDIYDRRVPVARYGIFDLFRPPSGKSGR